MVYASVTFKFGHWFCASFRYKDCLNSPFREEAMRLVLVEASASSDEHSDSAPSSSTEVQNADNNRAEENSTESPRFLACYFIQHFFFRQSKQGDIKRIFFSVGDTQLIEALSVCPSVHLFIFHTWVENAKTRIYHTAVVIVYVGVWVGGRSDWGWDWDEARDWMPLPTCPQQCCDPAYFFLF